MAGCQEMNKHVIKAATLGAAEGGYDESGVYSGLAHSGQDITVGPANQAHEMIAHIGCSDRAKCPQGFHAFAE
jgi:hypothetical protein